MNMKSFLMTLALTGSVALTGCQTDTEAAMQRGLVDAVEGTAVTISGTQYTAGEGIVLTDIAAGDSVEYALGENNTLTSIMDLGTGPGMMDGGMGSMGAMGDSAAMGMGNMADSAASGMSNMADSIRN